MPLGPAAPLADDSSRSPGVSDAVSHSKQPDGKRLASFSAAALAGNRYRGSATGPVASKPRYSHSHDPGGAGILPKALRSEPGHPHRGRMGEPRRDEHAPGARGVVPEGGFPRRRIVWVKDAD